MIEIEETMDYDVFKEHRSNRKKDQKLIDKLKIAITDKNLLKSHPIIVDKEFYVIDGQHRLEAAKQLGIPVFYISDSEIEEKDMISSNVNLKPWTINDYLNYFVSQGNEEYQLLESFVEREKIQLNIALQLLHGSRAPNFFFDFKKGLYKFPSKAEYMEVLIKKEQIKEIIEFIKKKTSGAKGYLDRVTFYGAMVEFFNCKSFSFDIFIKKLEFKINLIHPCARQGDYLNLFKEIYNFKNQTPIELENKS